MKLNKAQIITWLFYTYFFLIVVTRCIIFFNYNLKIIDTDQPYMWLGAIDFSKGLFYEPRYYGQDYNTFFEALIASPLLLFKLPVYVALPIVTNCLSLFPFLFLAFYLFFKKKTTQALVVLSVLICMPPQYDLLNSLPRGFVTGIFFTSFFIVSIFNPNNLKLIFFNTCMALIAYFVNQNSILVSAPFLFYLFLVHIKNKYYYYATGSALLFYLPLDLFFNLFYRIHPEYVMQSTFNTFSVKYFINSISHLDLRFEHISFFFANQSYTLLFILLLFGYFLFTQNKKAFTAFVIFISIILFSFFSSKVSDGSEWVFMSFSRMFLGIPIFLCLFLPLLKFNFKKFTLPLLFIPLAFSIYKLSHLKSELDKEDQRNVARGVRVLSLQSCIETCNFFKNKCKENNSDFFLVSTTYWLNTIASCAGPAIYSDYPETQETRFEKRYWIRNKNKNKLIRQFVFLSSEFELEKLLPRNQKFELQRLDDYGLYLVKNNQLPMGQFIENMNTIEPGLND